MVKDRLPEHRFWQIMLNDQAQVPNLLLKHYEQLGLSAVDCLHLIQLLAARPAGKDYLYLHDLQVFLGCEQAVAQALIADFAGRGLLIAATDGLATAYSFDGLWHELLEWWIYRQVCPQDKPQLKKRTRSKTPNDEEIKQIYRMFEAEKQQPLSPAELEKLSKWLIEDGWSGEMLKEALTRAVMHETVSFAYIDKILLRWQKEGINSLEQLEAERPLNEKKSRRKSSKSSLIGNQTSYDDIYK